jgi:TnpA family transposase
VSAISGLDSVSSRGEVKASASDGQRFGLARQVLQRTYTTKIRDFALEFYTFLADNYAPYYAMPVECTDYDAPFVLDGLIYNETDFELEEYYIDTHGYIEINFTAFSMLEKRFYPRLRDLQRQRIYHIDPERDYGMLSTLVNRSDSTIKPDFIVEH